MSVVIKSNKLYSGTKPLPTIDQISTTKQKVIDNYVSRVTADAGTIVNLDAVDTIVDFLFKENLVGRLDVCASPLFAYKLNSVGKVQKLYSIFGEDLVLHAVGTSPILPTIDPSTGFVQFYNKTADSIAILSTANKKKRNKNGSTAIACTIRDVESSIVTQVMGHWTHNNPLINGEQFSLRTQILQAGSLLDARLLTNSGYGAVQNWLNKTSGSAVVISYDGRIDRASMIVDGESRAIPLDGGISTGYLNREYYVDFGGMDRGASATVSSTHKMGLMLAANDITEEQAVELNKFIKNNILL